MIEFKKLSRVYVSFGAAISGSNQLVISEVLPRDFEIEAGEYVELIIRKVNSE